MRLMTFSMFQFTPRLSYSHSSSRPFNFTTVVVKCDRLGDSRWWFAPFQLLLVLHLVDLLRHIPNKLRSRKNRQHSEQWKHWWLFCTVQKQLYPTSGHLHRPKAPGPELSVRTASCTADWANSLKTATVSSSSDLLSRLKCQTQGWTPSWAKGQRCGFKSQSWQAVSFCLQVSFLA